MECPVVPSSRYSGIEQLLANILFADNVGSFQTSAAFTADILLLAVRVDSSAHSKITVEQR